MGVQIEKQSLLQFQILRAFPGLQGQRWQQIRQQEREIPFRIDLYIGRCRTILFHSGGQTFETMQGNAAVLREGGNCKIIAGRFFVLEKMTEGMAEIRLEDTEQILTGFHML